MIVVRCETCGRPLTDKEGYSSLEEAKKALRNKGYELIGEPNDPRVYCCGIPDSDRTDVASQGG